MSQRINQRRYTEAFKQKVLEEYRQGKWATPYEIAKAYGMSQVTAVAWIDAAGLEHLRNRRVLVHTLGEVSELQRLRIENKQIRTMLVDEMIKRHDVMRLLEAAVSRLGMKVSEFKAEFAKTDCTSDADLCKLDESVRN